jgi:peptidyl-prolyl cis-trans isomerase A (cyclophilin A)
MRSEIFLAAAGLVLVGCAHGPDQTGEKKLQKLVVRKVPPPEYRVKFETSKGDFIIDVKREWAPRGADHFFELVEEKFYDGVRFHRVVRGFVCQWGYSPDRAMQRLWGTMQIPDDPVKQKNLKATVAFAQLGPNTRAAQVFVNLRDNSAMLDKEGFAVFGKVSEGMDVVEKLYFAYGEVAPRGSGLDPKQIDLQGYSYLDRQYPRLDSIQRAAVVP